MNAKKSLVLGLTAFLFIALVFSSGCSGNGDDGPQTGQTFVGGSQGLVMSYLQNQPPSQVFQDNAFNVAFLIENKGEHDVATSDVRVTIEGINPSSFDNPTTRLTSASSALTGVKLTAGTTIQGGRTYETFEDYKYTAPIPSGSLSFTLRGKLCYLYGTLGASKVCLGQNVFAQTAGTQACEPSGPKAVESSAGPIKISSVEQAPSGNGFTFIINLANVGGGEVFDNSKLGPCSNGDLQYSDIGRIKVNSVSIGGVSLTCPDTVLIDTPIICKVESTSLGSGMYEDFLMIDLSYGYSQTTSTGLTVSSLG